MFFVTSFSQAGYEKYGRRFLESFVQHTSIPIKVYVEGVEPDDFQHEQVEYRDLYEVDQMWDFLVKVKAHEIMRGEQIVEDPKDRQKGVVYNYRYDAFKFARKIYAIWDAHEKATEGDTMVWIDADVIVLEDFDEELIHQFRPVPEVEVAYLGRRHLHSECGFVVYYDLRSEKMLDFFDLMRREYSNGAFVHLHEWHDCYVFDHARYLVGMKCFNISQDVPDEGLIHPWCYTILAKYFDHLKGPRKDLGYSPEHPEAPQEEHQDTATVEEVKRAIQEVGE